MDCDLWSDHICVSDDLARAATIVAAWNGTDTDGVRLSDHSGLVVDIQIADKLVTLPAA